MESLWQQFLGVRAEIEGRVSEPEATADLREVRKHRPADVASQNLSQAADNFEVNRRITFYNGFTGQYILVIEGLCSKGNDDTDKKVTFTCKVGPNAYKKHFLGVSDNVTYFVEQIDAAPASTYRYRVTFNPSALVPNTTMQ